MFVSRVTFRLKNEERARATRVEVAAQELPGGRTRERIGIFSGPNRPPLVLLDIAAARQIADALHDAADAIEGIEP